MKKNVDLSEPFSFLRDGKAYSVFIDDTGSNNIDKKQTVRFIAVVIDPEMSPYIPSGMNAALTELKKATGATEFHFSDLYQGQGEFRGVSVETRLRIFHVLVSLLTDIIKPAILVQSIDPDTLKEVHKQVTLPELPNFISLKVPSNFAIVGLLTQVYGYIKQARTKDQQGVVFCDQGILKSGRGIVFPLEPGVIHNNTVYFVDSKQLPGIQLADFAAFVLNRYQVLGQKQDLNDLEKTFVLITEPLAPLYRNIEAEWRRTTFNPKFHMSYLLKRELTKTHQRWLIIDERTGLVLLSEPRNEQDDQE